MAKPSFYLVSLGCSKNRCDAEVMLSRLTEAGYSLVEDPAQAEIILVNTCGFIQAAKEEAVDTVLSMAEYKKTGKCRVLGVTGCFSGRYGDQLQELLPEADLFLGVTQYPEIVSFVEKAAGGEKVCDCTLDEKIAGFFERVLTTPPWYAYLKIAEGCSNRCAFCAIPAIRGNYRSRPLDELIGEAESLARRGVKELIVIAQDTTRYGEDLYGQGRLPELLRRLCRIEGLHWIRFLYSYPERVTDELLRVVVEEPKICKYLDIPMQHADDAVLKAMRRRSSRAMLEELMEKLRALPLSVAVRTTMMVGFPGETPEAFQTLLHFIRAHPFDLLGSFIFSPEEGTPAEYMPGRPGKKTREGRMERLMLAQQAISKERLAQFVDKTLEVLAERELSPGLWQGRTQYQCPEIDGVTRFTVSAPPAPGTFLRVRITGSGEYDLEGELL